MVRLGHEGTWECLGRKGGIFESTKQMVPPTELHALAALLVDSKNGMHSRGQMFLSSKHSALRPLVYLPPHVRLHQLMMESMRPDRISPNCWLKASSLSVTLPRRESPSVKDVPKRAPKDQHAKCAV